MGNPINDNNKIVAILVYLDRKKTRAYVGRLTSANENGKVLFLFVYDAKYLRRKYAISLGPDLPFSEKIYKATELFPSFKDRIPSKENPAYIDYCRAAGISEKETDPLILLSTIGKRGPSSFIFEPEYRESFSAIDLKRYREMLGLTIREFASLFSISASHLQKIESGKFPGKDILKLIEIYKNHPAVSLEEIKKNSRTIHSDKYRNILKIFGINMGGKKAFNELGIWSDSLSFEEVDYTLAVAKKLGNDAWAKTIMENTEIKRAIAAVQGYDLLVEKMDHDPKIENLSPKDIPILIKTDNGKLWVFGKDVYGEPQLKQIDYEDHGIEFLEKPYKFFITFQPEKPEIYFILNELYHNHFNKEQLTNIKSRFFEIRFAHSIFKANLKAEYEVKGKGEKRIDFKIFGGKTKKNFLVELTSLRDSDEIKQNTWKIDDQFGISATSSNLDKENSSEEIELVKVQNIIFGKAKKFQETKSENYHIIIIDMRGFQIGISDEYGYHQIIYGGSDLNDEHRRYFIDNNGQKNIFKGVFEKSHPNQEALEKIHAVGFILEKSFTEQEIKLKTKLYSNPYNTTANDKEILEKLFKNW